jgi:hypothetical protein
LAETILPLKLTNGTDREKTNKCDELKRINKSPDDNMLPGLFIALELLYNNGNEKVYIYCNSYTARISKIISNTKPDTSFIGILIKIAQLKIVKRKGKHIYVF